jgi:hypothetical protein
MMEWPSRRAPRQTLFAGPACPRLRGHDERVARLAYAQFRKVVSARPISQAQMRHPIVKHAPGEYLCRVLRTAQSSTLSTMFGSGYSPHMR